MPLDDIARCPNCGKSPYSASKFKQAQDVEKVVNHSSVMGVPGKDAADFVSMKKARRRMQRIYALAFWMLVLVGVMGIAVYNDRISEEGLSEKLVHEEELRQKKKYELRSIRECVSLFSDFDAAETVEKKSSYVCGGVRMILDMEQSESRLESLSMSRPYALLHGDYLSNDERELVMIVVEDANHKRYEANFWKIDDEWKLDWVQHTRYNKNHWRNYLKYQPLKEEVVFNLYLRRKNVPGEKGAMLLVAYLPAMEIGIRDAASPAITIERGTDLYAEIDRKFDSLEQKASESGLPVLSELDGAGILRVRCSLVWQEGDNRERELTLTSVEKYDWLVYDSIAAE